MKIAVLSRQMPSCPTVVFAAIQADKDLLENSNSTIEEIIQNLNYKASIAIDDFIKHFTEFKKEHFTVTILNTI